MITFLRDFFRLEAAGGLVLMMAAALAMILANSPFYPFYLSITVPFAHAINDGLMAIFFLMVGLEVKREFIEGELSDRRRAVLPLVAAVGGVVLPAAIYAYFNWGTEAIRGWAIPSATDIAFSLAVLALFGTRAPLALKVFLMAVAVIDDLLAVIIIAAFYTSQIDVMSLILAASCALALLVINRRRVDRLGAYIFLGTLMWAAVLMSGVHATIAGVLLGLLVPLAPVREGRASLCRKLIHKLHPWVAFGILPVFAFANAGIPLAGLSLAQLTNPITLGIIVGLVAGKQLGIFSASWLMVKLRLAQLPEGVSWLQFYAVCAMAGIGFTMSLFIGGLALTHEESQLYIRLGVMVGSVLSAMIATIFMAMSLAKTTRG